jgi:hypothetical protein
MNESHGTITVRWLIGFRQISSILNESLLQELAIHVVMFLKSQLHNHPLSRSITRNVFHVPILSRLHVVGIVLPLCFRKLTSWRVDMADRLYLWNSLPSGHEGRWWTDGRHAFQMQCLLALRYSSDMNCNSKWVPTVLYTTLVKETCANFQLWEVYCWSIQSLYSQTGSIFWINIYFIPTECTILKVLAQHVSNV